MGEKMKDKMRLTPAALRAACEGDVANFFVAATPGGIEAQEAEGQQLLVRSTALPFEMRTVGALYAGQHEFWPMSMIKAVEIVQLWGIKLGQFDSEKDELFVDAELPPGWEKVPTEHNMWSTLVDDQGRHRAGIFYKAAFYDRKAHMHLDSRIQYEYDYDLEREQGVCVARIIADKRGHSRKTGYKSCIVLYETEPVKLPRARDDREGWKENAAVHDRIENETKAWASEHYPDWENPAAHWDTELEGRHVEHEA